MARDHHHVVSRGYLRFFADGELIRVIDKQTGDDSERGIPVAFVARNFNTMWGDDGRLDEAEDQWGHLETVALPAVREALRSGDLDSAAEHVKVLAAIHFARSFLVRAFFDQAYATRLADPTAGMDREILRSTFIEQYGRPAEPGEIELVVAGRVVDGFRTNVFFVHQMVRIHNKILARLWPLHLQPVRVLAPHRVPLVVGDVPVVRLPAAGLEVNVAMGDAEAVYMPLDSATGVSFTTHPQPAVEATPLGALQLNNYVWRSAQRYVACHPDADWRRALLL